MMLNILLLKFGGDKLYVILVYDISVENNGSRRMRRVFKICKKYLTHIQNSVFEGELTVAKLNKLKSELSKWIDKDLDSIIIFKSRSNKWLIKEFWGMDTSADNSNFF